MKINVKDARKTWEAGLTQRPILFVLLSGAAIATLVHCGGSSSSPTTQPTPPPTTTTTTTLPSNALPPGMVCDPTPPPLLYMAVGMHIFGGNRNVLDSHPIVANINNYCDRVGIGHTKWCSTRLEGDLQRVACDYMATGKAKGTGRWGPTWFYNGGPCMQDPQKEGCSDFPDNQFMAVTKGDGEYAACASTDVPLAPDAERCGVCHVVEAKGKGCW